MRINIDRLCRLAGIESGNSSRRSLTESSNRSMHEDPSLKGESEWRYGSNQLAEGDEAKADEEEPLEEGDDVEVEVDEQMLVQELRRARKIMNESRRRKTRSQQRQRRLKENKLQSIIEEEVDNVMREMNLTGGWIYGKRKPRNSRKGHVNTAFPGIGFR